MENKIIDAGDVARERFFKFLDEKLKGEDMDTARWEFFTSLLEQASKLELNHCGYGSHAYQQDRNTARDICRQREAGYKEGEHRIQRKTRR